MRIPANLPAVVTTRTDSVSSRVGEIGEGGCLLRSKNFLGPGRIVTLKISLNFKLITALAKVIYEYKDDDNDVCAGFEFLEVVDDDVLRIRSFVSREIQALAGA